MFAGALEDCVLQFFSEAYVTLDVLDRDRGVIDQNPDCQGKAGAWWT